MRFMFKTLQLAGFLVTVSCANGEFLGSQRGTQDCRGGESGCKKDIMLGEAVDSLQETTSEDSNSTPAKGQTVAVGVEISGSQSSTSSSSQSDGLCTIPATNVGVSGKLMGKNWYCRLDTMSIPDAVVLPSDAYDINVKITQYGVDDWNPCAKLNGHEIICNKKEKTVCTGGGPGPRSSKFDFDLSPHLKAGQNELYVESFNKHTYWSMWFTVEGTYRTNQEGCNHSLKLIKE